jgi:uncharacterized membrane protein
MFYWDGNFWGLGALGIFLAVVFGIIGLALYFLPTIIAVARKHPNTTAIVLIDVLLGWTFLGWVGALVWSLLTPSTVVVTPTGSNALDIARDRYARGEISKEEFEQIKRDII